ncbi:HAD family hydrolase [Streptomyces syringium]|uniref:Phosphoglycolate phosphatase-like HAD superfamily hydrolase n=1 Tax=Streptomyces syringium TaxID=76729 RepID=A0ABS4Y390_9ACTN|nr:haloacid dehalogenase-like hydrolase [Streptomyces syringium]MBP2403246.1 phosphoglycolate phosphatase-like HAD superfamily hydrolase [Streptomyces syringium]
MTSAQAHRRLVLWDIDHTLIDGGGVSREAYAAAFSRVTGQPLREMADMSGRTELAISTDTLRLHGLTPDPAMVERFTAAVAEELHAREEALASAGRPLPGARAAISALSSIEGTHQSLLTGNMRSLAELKMRVFGLAEHIDFEAGAYGDDDVERPALLAHAWRRARSRHCHRYTGRDTVIIGDTVLDVATAKAGGARSIAVATGTTSAAELAASGADVVLPDLTDTAALVAAVGGGDHPAPASITP